ncbi:hypothetical protein SAMD00019534_091870 [Acytostelium subglobosum LB1]|uniref:hypothetical protein n=1 Tax=Acytostelium subglobosum LB1 TaxID=1410327 RepID=UPI000644E76B|nr:hypothetical protein SAMD00019534_091870 [Acytostelium subglobosum LB1]GAM26012.1 hypothetical protein SAMD00019534_091870 [Acytostelium subglobosum LB1]|eukprot:XP_012751055.1 hypothetical protein SAMD00019534_091870 [Acytostelium subglobosum LB1]
MSHAVSNSIPVVGATAAGVGVTNNNNNNSNNNNNNISSTVAAGVNNNGNNNNNSSTPNSSSSSSSDVMNPIKTFEHLLRKSQSLFVGLRDLPQFGRQWQPFFQKTFELYTKLWKHQQQYRSLLETDKYGLKRCEIGEIASKIGQLYYHYYLRTSDTSYLHESYIFYEAIRLRSYFKDVSVDAKMSDMMVKQLRYYARFIVVCLLLNKKKVVYDLVEELFKHIKDYTKTHKPNDAHEWSLVIQEIFTFLQADQCVSFSDSNGPMQVSHRLNPHQGTLPSPCEPSSILQQAILVGNHHNQIKFSEITLDMFRMTQSLEYDTPELKDPSDKQDSKSGDNSSSSSSGASSSSSSLLISPSSSKKKNPHKYLLYRPTISQLLLFLSNTIKELGDNKALLLYLSVDGIKNGTNNTTSTTTTTTTTDRFNGGYSGGLLMNGGGQKPQPQAPQPQTQQQQQQNGNNNNNNNNNSSTINDNVKSDALYPFDLLPYCRKPFFLIIDSKSSQIFKDFQPPFDQPFVSLLSPLSTPKKIVSNGKRTAPFGNLFTFFLHDPLCAFCDTTACNKISSKSLSNYQSIVQSAMNAITKTLFDNVTSLPPSFAFFLNDDFLRSFIVRFIFCHAVFHLHKDFQENIYQVSSSPAIPQSILTHRTVLNTVNQLAVALNVTDQFNDLPTDELQSLSIEQ